MEITFCLVLVNQFKFSSFRESDALGFTNSRISFVNLIPLFACQHHMYPLINIDCIYVVGVWGHSSILNGDQPLAITPLDTRCSQMRTRTICILTMNYSIQRTCFFTSVPLPSIGIWGACLCTVNVMYLFLFMDSHCTNAEDRAHALKLLIINFRYEQYYYYLFIAPKGPHWDWAHPPCVGQCTNTQ